MIEAPPFDPAVHDTTDCRFAFEVADTPVGASGGPTGMTAADAADAAPVPEAFVAVTVNVYAVPFVRPETVQVVGGTCQVVVVLNVGNPFTIFVVVVMTGYSTD